MKFCPNCGNKIQVEGVKFCYECGYKLPQIESKATETAKAPAPKVQEKLKNATVEDGVLIEYTGKDENVVIPGSIKVIGECAFVDNLTLKSVVISEGVTEIESSAFDGCKNLKSVVIPKTVKVIGAGAFTRCALESLELPEGVEKIEDEAFSECEKLKSIKLPNTLVELGESVFVNASAPSVKVPASVKEIGKCAFWGIAVEVDPANKYYKSVAGHLFSKDGTVLCSYNSRNTLTSYVVPNGVKRISEEAFSYATYLKNLVVASTVEAIEECAFEGCKELIGISLLDGLKEIMPSAFDGCKKLPALIIPKTVDYIGHFSGCDALTTIYVGKGKKYTQLPNGINVIEY